MQGPAPRPGATGQGQHAGWNALDAGQQQGWEKTHPAAGGGMGRPPQGPGGTLAAPPPQGGQQGPGGTPGGTLMQPPSGPPAGSPPQQLNPQALAMVQGTLGTPYWQDQLKTNPMPTQQGFSPPAANQLFGSPSLYGGGQPGQGGQPGGMGGRMPNQPGAMK